MPLCVHVHSMYYSVLEVVVDRIRHAPVREGEREEFLSLDGGGKQGRRERRGRRGGPLGDPCLLVFHVPTHRERARVFWRPPPSFFLLHTRTLYSWREGDPWDHVPSFPFSPSAPRVWNGQSVPSSPSRGRGYNHQRRPMLILPRARIKTIPKGGKVKVTQEAVYHRLCVHSRKLLLPGGREKGPGPDSLSP